MKNLSLIILFFAFSPFVHSQVNPQNHYVEGYTKKNGTYVEGHYQTDPNNTINDNYSTYPNVNPYTGKQGTISPDYYTPTYTQPSYNTPTYSQPTYTQPINDIYRTNDLFKTNDLFQPNNLFTPN